MAQATYAQDRPRSTLLLPHTYLGVARGMLPSVKILAEADPLESAYGLSLVAAHALECVLKAYLSRNGSDTHLRAKNVRHNLAMLWTMAACDGLPLAMPPPNWVGALSSLHDSPYYLRYSSGVHGIAFPSRVAMALELSKVFKLVESTLLPKSI